MHDYRAAHTMDSGWFAVDEKGRVALFETDEAGALPRRLGYPRRLCSTAPADPNFTCGTFPDPSWNAVFVTDKKIQLADHFTNEECDSWSEADLRTGEHIPAEGFFSQLFSSLFGKKKDDA